MTQPIKNGCRCGKFWDGEVSIGIKHTANGCLPLSASSGSTPKEIHTRATALLDLCYDYWPKLNFVCNYRTKQIHISTSTTELGRVNMDAGAFLMCVRAHIDSHKNMLKAQLAELEQK